MEIYYAVWINNRISDRKSGLSDVETWSRSRLEIVSENLHNSDV